MMPLPTGRSLCVVHSVLLASLLALGQADAQYIYMDTNHDGVHTSADRLSPTDTTRVDIWLCTDRRRDGSPVDVACPGGGGWTWKGPQLSVMGFGLTLRATNGTVNWISFEPGLGALWQRFRETLSDTTEYSTSLIDTSPGRTNLLPPGRLKLGTLTVSVRTGTPSLSFVPGSWEGGDRGTCYFTPCLGKTFSDEVCLGPHWTDADSLPFGGKANSPPELAEIPWLNVREGETLEQPIEASDPDRQPLTFKKLDGPSFVSVRTVDSGHGTATGLIRVAPGPCDMGVLEGRLAVSDGLLSASRIFHLTVRDVPQAREPNPLESTPPSAATRIAYATRPIQSDQDSTWIYGDWEWATESGWKTLREVFPVDAGKIRRLVLAPGNKFEYYEGLPSDLRLVRAGKFSMHRNPSGAGLVVDSLAISEWGGRFDLRSAGPDVLTLYPSGVTDANQATYVRVGDVPRAGESERQVLQIEVADSVSIGPARADHWVALPKWASKMIKKYDPRMEAWRRRDFAPAVLDSYPFGPSQTPSVVIGDFDGDLRPDIVLYGHDGRVARLICVLSDHGRHRLVEIARGREVGDAPAKDSLLTHSLRLVPRGTQLPWCDGKHLFFGTDGVVLLLPDGSPYFYHYSGGVFHEFVPGN